MSDIYTIQQIRERIQEQFRRDPKIHINVSLTHPKIHLDHVAVEITGVYAHIFQIEETTAAGEKKRYTLQYADVLLHNIEILELA